MQPTHDVKSCSTTVRKVLCFCEWWRIFWRRGKVKKVNVSLSEILFFQYRRLFFVAFYRAANALTSSQVILLHYVNRDFGNSGAC